MDEFFLYDSPENRANILTVMHLEDRVDNIEDFGNYVLNTVVGEFPRMRHKLRKVGGEYYFE